MSAVSLYQTRRHPVHRHKRSAHHHPAPRLTSQLASEQVLLALPFQGTTRMATRCYISGPRTLTSVVKRSANLSRRVVGRTDDSQAACLSVGQSARAHKKELQASFCEFHLCKRILEWLLTVRKCVLDMRNYQKC